MSGQTKAVEKSGTDVEDESNDEQVEKDEARNDDDDEDIDKDDSISSTTVQVLTIQKREIRMRGHWL